MKRRETLKYLQDIVDACARLAEFTERKSYNDYCRESLLRSAVERQFEIIGEALNQALKVDPKLAESISNSGRIIAFRNRLIHAYGEISNELVWSILETQLPRLDAEARTVRNKLAEGLEQGL